ncbi:ABC transporter ATP-binding protein [Paenibacillus chartarius]|uniref:ABC transporter ATP-binding protein n=1 Tax=Paenibacillus chartarius TaxID=747481 RepID=A0ABV6DLJ0_9BACL
MELILNGVTKTYGAKQALQGITLRLGPGIVGLLGPNGAGKSTLMRLLATIEKPTEGSILWDGADIAKHPNRLREVLGYLPQQFGVYPNMTPVEFLEYIAAMKGLSRKSAKRRIQELLEMLNLGADSKRLLGGFSGGMKQRVGIAQSLLNDPSLLIVDEPTVGLDPEERIRFRNILSMLASNRIVILSTHIVTDIETVAPQIAVMLKGKLVRYAEPEEWLQIVEGKVWNVVVPSSELIRIQETYPVSAAIHRRDGVHVRIVSEREPDLPAALLPPALEDAYLYTASKWEVTP